MAITNEIIIIAVLILINGFFSMAEFALVASRRVRLQQMVDKGDQGSRLALQLTENPNTFLSTIQIAITLIGILAGAFGGAAVAAQISPMFSNLPILGDYQNILSLILVVLIITFFTLIFGELVPKRIGLIYPERIASFVAYPINTLSRVIGPVNKVCSKTTDGVLWIFGSATPPENAITEEDITNLLEEGTQAGVFDATEQEMVESIFRFGDREVQTLMIPRPDVVFLDLDDTHEDNIEIILSSGHTRYPVCRGGLDSILGVISIRDLWSQTVNGQPIEFDSLIKEALVIPEHITGLRLLELFRTATTPLAIIMDEYGSVSGIITLHDLLEAIVGDLSTVDASCDDPTIVEREDGSWFVDGMVSAEDLRELLEVESLPGEKEGVYRTAAGLVMNELGKIPSTGDHFILDGYRFEVADMDDRRVDKILISRIEMKGSPDSNYLHRTET